MSLFLFSFFLLPFFLLMSCQGDLMAEDKTRHQEKWMEAVVGMATKIWKGGLLLAWFELEVWVDGPELPMKMRRLKCFGTFGSNGVFLVIEWHRQPAGPPLVKACHHILMFFSLSVFFILFMFTPLHSRRGKRLAERLGNLRRWSWTQRIKWSVSKIQGRSC